MFLDPDVVVMDQVTIQLCHRALGDAYDKLYPFYRKMYRIWLQTGSLISIKENVNSAAASEKIRERIRECLSHTSTHMLPSAKAL